MPVCIGGRGTGCRCGVETQMPSPAVAKFNRAYEKLLLTPSSHVVGDKAYPEHVWVLRAPGKGRLATGTAWAASARMSAKEGKAL